MAIRVQRGSPRRMTKTLSTADVKKLLADPSVETRADVAAKLAQQVDGSALTREERAIAEDIIRALSHDAALRVRQALSDHLKESRNLPHDVAMALAHDVDSVALPVLSRSVVLSDADLIEIVRCSGAAKQEAIAVRDKVSAQVAEAIVEADQPSALAKLVGNDGAELAEPTLKRVLDRHGENEAIQQPMARRVQLPVTILERLVAEASSSLRETLAKLACGRSRGACAPSAAQQPAHALAHRARDLPWRSRLRRGGLRRAGGHPRPQCPASPPRRRAARLQGDL